MTMSAGVAANATAENAVDAAMAMNSLENLKCLTPVLIVLKRPEATAQAADRQGLPYRAQCWNGPLQMRRGQANSQECVIAERQTPRAYSCGRFRLSEPHLYNRHFTTLS